MIVTLGKVINATKSSDLLGISDRVQIIDYISRAVEIAAFRANWNPYVSTLDICSDHHGCITLPDFVDVVLAANVGGRPALFRNSWYEYHINGLGSNSGCGGPCGVFWDDRMWSPVFQQPKEWSLLAALCEDPTDGDGTKELIVRGETVDANYNSKEVTTVMPDGTLSMGVRIKLLNGVAATDPKVTYFKNITQVVKPVTRGYVKLLAFPPTQLAMAATVGYFGPRETNPRYKRMKVSCTCEWVRVKYRRKTIDLVEDEDIVPLSSYQATLDLIKAIRLRETNNIDLAEKYEAKAVELLSEIQSIEDGPNFGPLQVDPSFGIGTVDYR
jgi:hypothetical protein